MVQVNVFLVEDSPAVLDRLEKMLNALPDARIVGRAGGVRDAIDGILASQPELVLLDLSLSPGSGFDVLSAVRRDAPGIDFYILSNFSSEPYRRHAHRLGAKDFFDKSADFERVRDVIATRAAATQH